MNHITKTTAASVGFILLFCMLLTLMGCFGTGDSNSSTGDGNSSIGDGNISTAAKVQTFNSEAELETYLKDQFANSVYAQNYRYAEDDGSVMAADESNSSSGSGEYSQTNIQEAGVDESDVVKTDGANFYVSDEKSFHIINISDPMQVVATRAVNGYVKSLYLYDQKLVVLYTLPQADDTPWPDIQEPLVGARFGIPYWIPVSQRQGVAIYDISDPGKPTNIKTVELDGHLASSRLISGKLHVVQQYVPKLPELDYSYGGTQEDLEKKIQSYREAMADVPLNQLIPYYTVVGDAPGLQTDLPVVSARNFYCPASRDGGGTITTIVSFDLDDPALPFESVGIVANAHIVYASRQALYVATHKYNVDILLPEDTKTTTEESVIYKFDLTGENVQCTGSGVIPGWILNQFSLGEYQGVLRVAATTGRAGGWAPTSHNHVYCLKLEEETLKIIGRIEDLAPGEQIYSARFIGEWGYLVTYVNIDPLFTLDLSDPSAPEVAGYLKVPGYSLYIHPYGDDYLITLGKDARLAEGYDNMAWYQGIQLSIFQVGGFDNPDDPDNPYNPVLLHHEIIGDRGTESKALYNHKAFTFWAANDLLALPVELYEHSSPPEYPWSYGERTFQGLYVYRISSDNGFDFLGRISTSGSDGSFAYNPPWTRGIFVDQQVYAITPDAVRSAQIDRIEEENVQTLPTDR